VARIVVFERIIAPFLLGKTPDEKAIAAALPAGRVCVDELNRLLGGNPYFAGADFSLADILLAPQLYYLAATPEGSALIDGTPLAAWLDRVGRRPSLLATLPPEGLRKAA
jgi:glutathione S-transferase